MLLQTPILSGAPLTPEQVAPPPPAPQPVAASDPAACTRDEMDARASACRPCPHAAHGSTSCEACDLRCMHTGAEPGAQLIARRASTCPADRWPLLS